MAVGCRDPGKTWGVAFFCSPFRGILTWPMAKLSQIFGIAYLVGKIKFKLFFFRVHWLSENLFPKKEMGDIEKSPVLFWWW